VFVTQHGLAPGARAIEVPPNLFDALASDRPVLAALPPGDSAELVRKAKAGLVAPADDAATLSRLLEQLVREHRSGGGRRPSGARARMAGFERSLQAAALQQILQAVAGGEPLPPVADPWQA
jgi:glycosyltransferase involved in cell wall biosynthesis